MSKNFQKNMFIKCKKNLKKMKKLKYKKKSKKKSKKKRKKKNFYEKILNFFFFLPAGSTFNFSSSGYFQKSIWSLVKRHQRLCHAPNPPTSSKTVRNPRSSTTDSVRLCTFHSRIPLMGEVAGTLSSCHTELRSDCGVNRHTPTNPKLELRRTLAVPELVPVLAGVDPRDSCLPMPSFFGVKRNLLVSFLMWYLTSWLNFSLRVCRAYTSTPISKSGGKRLNWIKLGNRSAPSF